MFNKDECFIVVYSGTNPAYISVSDLHMPIEPRFTRLQKVIDSITARLFGRYDIPAEQQVLFYCLYMTGLPTDYVKSTTRFRYKISPSAMRTLYMSWNDLDHHDNVLNTPAYRTLSTISKKQLTACLKNVANTIVKANSSTNALGRRNTFFNVDKRKLSSECKERNTLFSKNFTLTMQDFVVTYIDQFQKEFGYSFSKSEKPRPNIAWLLAAMSD